MPGESRIATRLIIEGPEGKSEVELDPKGASLGREPSCDIVLAHSSVSRLHARIYEDPFGRWVVEDMGSHNGVLVEGKRITTQVVLPNQKIIIHPFMLTLSPEIEQTKTPDTTNQTKMGLVDRGIEEEVVSYQPDTSRILSAALLKKLNEIFGELLKMRDSSDLYTQASQSIAEMLDSLVAFVRLPSDPEPLTPTILACHYGTRMLRERQKETIRLSKRVLEAVRTKLTPVMARSGPSADKGMVLTVVDTVNPHVVFAAPINESGGTVDAIYLDILEERMPPEMFDFVEAVSRQITAVQKNLAESQAKAEMMVIERQLTVARDIQSKLNPEKLEQKFEVDIATVYKPAMWVGGDYCDVWTLEDDRICFAVGDVSGKGLPAAMIMSNLQAALRTTMSFCSEVSTAVEHVNRHLCASLRDDMFITFFLGLFCPKTHRLDYVNAGHIPPIVKNPGKEASILSEATNIPLGIFEGEYESATETIAEGTGILVVTDGITEANSPDEEMFELDVLQGYVSNLQFTSAQQFVDDVVKGVTDFRKHMPQQDDITVLALLNQKNNE